MLTLHFSELGDAARTITTATVPTTSAGPTITTSTAGREKVTNTISTSNIASCSSTSTTSKDALHKTGIPIRKSVHASPIQGLETAQAATIVNNLNKPNPKTPSTTSPINPQWCVTLIWMCGVISKPIKRIVRGNTASLEENYKRKLNSNSGSTMESLPLELVE